MSGEDEGPVAWLWEVITADRDYAVVHLARPSPGSDLGALRERLARCNAERAILHLYKEQEARSGENAMEEDRAWTLWPVVSLLASGYQHRPGYREEWAPVTSEPPPGSSPAGAD